jgi:hypothetical protein
LLPLVLLVLGLLVRNVLLIQAALLRLWRFVAHVCLRSMAKAIACSMILLCAERKPRGPKRPKRWRREPIASLGVAVAIGGALVRLGTELGVDRNLILAGLRRETELIVAAGLASRKAVRCLPLPRIRLPGHVH